MSKQYAIFNDSEVYHYVCSEALMGADVTLCGQLIGTRNGVPYDGVLAACVPTEPTGLRLCRNCERARDGGRTVPKYVARLER